MSSSPPPHVRAHLFSSLPIIRFFSSHVNVLYMHKRAKQNSCWLKSSPSHADYRQLLLLQIIYALAAIQEKAQSESCWQEAAALHLCVEVSVNKMCLSSAPSSLLTSVLIMTSPRHCSLLFFHFQFSTLIRIIPLLPLCHHGLDHIFLS